MSKIINTLKIAHTWVEVGTQYGLRHNMQPFAQANREVTEKVRKGV